VGKTTVARRLVEVLRARGVPVGGFTTEEIRQGRRRVGFAVESMSGERAVLAHVDLPGPLRVSRYGVDLETFERVALPTVTIPSGVLVIDELGKMELASERFRRAVEELLHRDVSMVATVHVHRHPFTDPLKRRLEVVPVTTANRNELPEVVAERLTPTDGHGDR
jgi:nucleoside-triphosphatase